MADQNDLLALLVDRFFDGVDHLKNSVLQRGYHAIAPDRSSSFPYHLTNHQSLQH